MPTAACAITASLAAAAPAVSETLGPWPWVFALILVGMPHGAMDWAVNNATRTASGRTRGLRGFAWYGAIMAASIAAFIAAPVWTCIAFLVLTMVHFGSADAHEVDGSQLKRRAPIAWWALALGRGATVILLPFAVDPEAAWSPFATLSGAPLAESITKATSIAASVGSIAAIAAVAIGIAGIWKHISVGDRCRLVAESIAAMTMLAIAPPLLAVGIYFMFVHATKHTVRLSRHDELLTGLRRNADTLTRMFAVHIRSLPLLVPAIIAVLVWAWLLGGLDVTSIAAASIGFYIISTLPHHLLGLQLSAP